MQGVTAGAFKSDGILSCKPAKEFCLLPLFTARKTAKKSLDCKPLPLNAPLVTP